MGNIEKDPELNKSRQTFFDFRLLRKWTPYEQMTYSEPFIFSTFFIRGISYDIIKYQILHITLDFSFLFILGEFKIEWLQ